MSELVDGPEVVAHAAARVAYWQRRIDAGTLAGTDAEAARRAYTVWAALQHSVALHESMMAATGFREIAAAGRDIAGWTLTAGEELDALKALTVDEDAASEVALHAKASASNCLNLLAWLMGHASSHVKSHPEFKEHS